MSDENDDWPSFIAQVAELIRAGATTESLTRMFAGNRVRWTGILNDVDPDDRAPVAGVRMPEINVDVGKGKKTTVNTIAVPIAEEFKGHWTKVSPGDQVVFEATFVSHPSPFPPIQLFLFDTGETLLMIRLRNGKLIQSTGGQ